MKQSKKVFGLIGYPLEHSFSQKYFTEKFKQLNLLGYSYKLFPLDHIMQFPELIMRNTNLAGLNVTIPYKEDIMNFLDQIEHEASDVGAVNTIKIRQTAGDVIVKGYNTDIYGFENSLVPFIGSSPLKALVFGSGGASKAVVYILKKLNINYIVVTRKPQNNSTTYTDLSKDIYNDHLLWINTTPVGMSPHDNEHLPIDFDSITSKHFIYDLVYNPEKTMLLTEAEKRGARIKNGLEMLQLQAEKSFEIWEDSKIK